MPDHWQETTLGEVGEVNPKAAPLAEDAPFVPMDAVNVGQRWVEYTEPRGSRSGARARAGDVLFARITPCLENGKTAQVQREIDRCGGSTEFIVLRGTERLDADFLYFWATDRNVRERAANLMTGSTGRQRLSPKDLAAMTLSVPPISEQRRIVDLVESIDNHIDALQGQIDATRTARQGVLSELLSNGGSDWNSSSISDLLTHTIGGIWGQEVGTNEVDASVIRSTNFTADGNPDSSDVAKRSVTRKQLAGRELQQGDILLEKSGGGPKQPVGRVLFIGQEMPQTVCANFVQLIRCNGERAEPRFLFLRLWLDHLTGLTQAFQAATTGIRNLRTKDYLLREIAVPPIEEQKRIVDLIGSFDEQISALERQVDAARGTRSGVLAELLSGDRLLDESYDKAVGW